MSMTHTTGRARPRHWRRVATLGAALLLVAAACGDDDDGEAASDTTAAAAETTAAAATTTAAADTTAAASDTTRGGATTTAGGTTTTGASGPKGTIKLGTIGAGVSATSGQATLEETKEIAEEWVNEANAAGGINGYQIELVYKDGQNDTARVLQAVTELDQEGVLGIIGQGIATRITGSIPKIDEAKIPIVGGTPYTPEFDTNANFFQVSSSYYAGVAGQVFAAKAVGATHFRNVYCTESPACAQSVPVTEAAAAVAGLDFSQASASAVAPDYTATCLDAQSAGVDFFQANGMNVPNLIRDCDRQNYHPTYGVGGVANQRTIDELAGNAYAGNLYEFGAFYEGPEVQRFRDAIERTDLAGEDWGQTAIQAWLGWEMAGKAIENLTSPNPTREDFVEALLSIEDEDLDGQIAPVDYSEQRDGGHFQQDCWTQHAEVDGALVHIDAEGNPVDKLTFICGSKG